MKTSAHAPCNLLFEKQTIVARFSSFWIVVNMAYQAELSGKFDETSDVTRENAPKLRWSDHEVEQLIDLLEENSCLWDVSNKDYLLRKKRERAYKQIEEMLRTERAVIKAKILTLRQQCWQLLRSFACTTH